MTWDLFVEDEAGLQGIWYTQMSWEFGTSRYSKYSKMMKGLCSSVRPGRGGPGCRQLRRQCIFPQHHVLFAPL